MCDVGETRVLPNGGSSPSVIRRPMCEQATSPSLSTPGTPTSLRRASSLEKCFSDPEFFRKQRQQRLQRDQRESEVENESENSKDRVDGNEVITNGASKSGDADESCNGKEIMAPVLGVPPPPPPAPHMGPDGLILPRKLYNPCLTSNNHKDLRRELLFNQKIGKNVLNQKSELQRALEKHREMVSRKEAEKVHEESYKNDPRTALQRAIEQRAKHIQQTQQPQPVEPANPLVTARAKLRSLTDSQ